MRPRSLSALPRSASGPARTRHSVPPFGVDLVDEGDEAGGLEAVAQLVGFVDGLERAELHGPAAGAIRRQRGRRRIGLGIVGELHDAAGHRRIHLLDAKTRGLGRGAILERPDAHALRPACPGSRWPRRTPESRPASATRRDRRHSVVARRRRDARRSGRCAARPGVSAASASRCWAPGGASDFWRLAGAAAASVVTGAVGCGSRRARRRLDRSRAARGRDRRGASAWRRRRWRRIDRQHAILEFAIRRAAESRD